MRHRITIRRRATIGFALLFALSLLGRSAHFVLVPHSLNGHAHVETNTPVSEGLCIGVSHTSDADACGIAVLLRPRGSITYTQVPVPNPTRFQVPNSKPPRLNLVSATYAYAPKQSPPQV